MSDGGALSGVYVGFIDGQLTLASYTSDGRTVGSGTLGMSQPSGWFHVTIDFVQADGGFSATVGISVDGVLAGSATVSAPGIGDHTRFLFGANPSGPLDGGPFAVRVDNVFVQ